MHNRNLIVFVAFFVCLLAVSAVSANDANDAVTASVDAGRVSLSSSNVMIEDNLQINEDNSTLTHVDSTHDQLKIENDDEKLSVLNDENVLSSAETFNGTTFSELRSKINSLKNGDVLDLTSNVTQDGNSYIAISKSITINGNGITIDAKGKSRIFNIQSSATVVLNNITFTNGYHGEQAGAINIENGKVTITSSNFIKNIAQEDGGAIYNKGTLNIADTYFIANKANKWDGGAIFNNGGTKMTLADSHFINNTAGDGGGAIINLGDCNVNITDSYFINNIAYVRQNYDGGAIFSFTSNVNIERSYFANNKAKNYGGAVESWYGKTNIEDSYFIANKVDRWNGGAVFADSCDFTVTGSLFINNTANHYGGALYISNNNNEKVTNSVFINNKADGRNPNTYNIDNDRTTVYSKDSPLIINDNWWGTNDPVWKDLIYGANPSSYAVLNVSADAVIIPWGSAVKLDYAFYKNGTDELLSLPARPIELSATGGQLDNTSGNLTGVFSIEFSCDTLGDYEITAKVDNQEIKIAEKVISMLYVNSTAVPGGDGKSEATPFQTLKEALDVAVDDYTLIRIASGTYTGNDNIGLTVDKNLTLEKYGDGEATFDAQGLDRILTVDAGAVNVIGLTFRNGKFAGNGGAIYFDGLGKVENCTFINNTALEGGAIYFYTASTVTNSDFTNNSAASGGGAIYFVEIGDVADCTFANNKATTYGGAIEFAAEGSLTNCNFTNNTANKDGGAVCFDKTGNVTNCNFTNNTADQNGGAIKFNSTGNLTNSNFAGNIAKGNKCYGGAVWINSGSVENCNFTDNKATGLESRGNAIYFENNGNVTNCNFTNHNVANCGAVFFFKNANLRNCNFINNTNALFIVEYGDVESCNFINNKANKDPGNIGAARVNHGHVINCNFTNNTASHYTGALDMLGGTVENCTFINNSAADEGGALGFMYEAKVMNCNFTNNKATSGCGGAIYFFNPGEVINCYFTNNTAKNGGAVYFMNGGNVARCNFTGNKAIAGSAIYFYGDKYERSISNSSFLNNRANADADTPLTVTINENDITIIFKGQNNYLNAIYSRFDREFKFSNVTYWGAKGISNTDTDAPVKSNCEAGQNITVKGVANGNILDITSVTDDEGKIVLDISAGDNYYITVRHDEDSYYTEVEKVISKNMAYTVNVTSQTTHNKTVNVTAKSDIFNEVLPGRLLFILPDGTKINATYASNGIWWTVHKFDDYTEYDVNASYVGLDNVTFKNATINITRADSTITLDNIIRDYGNSTNITITTEGATAVTAKINDKDVDVIDNYTIPISGLGAGNYTLTVTTTPDEDHNSVTKTVKITVNKRFTEITLTNETLDLKAKESVGTGAALTPGDAGTLNYTSSNEDVVKVENGKIIAIAAGKANITVSFAGNDNNTAAESKNITVTVTPIDTNVTVNKTKFELVIGDITYIIANATPEGLVIDYATDDTDVISIDKNGHIIALSNGTALIFVSVGDNRIYDYNVVNVYVVVKKYTEITLTNETFDLKANESVGTGAALTPGDAGSLNYTSSNEDVVKVENGKIIAVGAGKATIIVSFTGNDNYAAAESKNIAVTVTPLDASISVNKTKYELIVGDEADIVANATPEGLVIDYATDDTNIVSIDKNGHITALSNGTALIFVSVGDNRIYDYEVVNVIVTVKKTTEIDVNVNADENNVTITATVDSTASGFVKYIINGQDVYVDVNNGEAIYNIILPADNYTVQATYMGDNNFNSNSTSESFTVWGHVKQNTNIIPNVTVNNDTATITVIVNENATGSVIFAISGKTFIVPVESGKAVFSNDFKPGPYTANITYLGDDDFNANSTEITFSVVEKPLKDTSIDVGIDIDDNNVTIWVVVDRNATGFVKFEVSGAENYTVYEEVARGKVALEDVLAVGDYTVVVTYLGDDEFNSNSTVKSFTIAGHVKKDTSISAVPKVDNYTATIKIEVAENATGSVTIGILGQNFIVPVESGNAIFSYDFKPGTYTANITYLGDNDFNANSTTATFTITEQKVDLKNTIINVDVKAVENDVTITASVDSSASGLVSFNIGGAAVYVAVNNGKAVYNTDLPAGDYNVEVVYLGDSKFNANRTSKAFTVFGHVKQNTTVDLNVTQDNGNVTITVNVNENATGFVKFNINGNELFAEVKDGKATLNKILPVGNYTVAAAYLGDDNFNANSTEITFSVVEKPLKDTPIDIKVAIDDNNVTITVNVDVNATGFVKFDVSGAENYTLYEEVARGKVVLEDVLAVGDYMVVVTYLGDDEFNSNSTADSFTIVGHVKKDTSISAVPKVDNYTATINVKVDENATGSVTIGILGQNFIVPVEMGKAVFSYDFKPGTYTANITYLGDNDFNANSTTATFTITEQKVDLKNTTIDVDVKAVENDVTVTASVDSSASGLVSFNIGGDAVYVAVNNGKAVYNTNLPTGDYNVEVVYLGDSKFNANRTSKAFTVFGHVKQNTTVDLNVTQDNGNVTITVNVNDNATGFVKFNINGNELFAEVKDGKATLNTILPVGNYTVAAAYLGDDDFNANSTEITFSVVEKPLKDTPVDVDIQITENNITITAGVDMNATGLVKFVVSGAENYTLYGEVINGKAILEDILKPGDYTVYATYMGDENFNMNSTAETFTIVGHVKKDTAISAVPNVNDTTVSISIDVDKNATGSVTIGILGQNFIVPVENGKASFTYDFIPGTYSANIVYLGDDNFNNATTSATFTVIQKASELKNTTIDVDVKAAENDVTITASVDSSASGLVSFNIGGDAVYVAVANGKAVYNTDLPAGDYNVEVVYLGDSKFNANRTSKAFTVVAHVKQNTAVVPDVIQDNNNVTITVNVDEDATGFVKFNINGNELFAEVKDGKATLNTILPVGNYTIVASYLGDDDFNANSTEITFSVVEKPLKDTPIDIKVAIDDNNVTITVNVDVNATGFVKFEVSGAENYTLYEEVVGGKVVLEDVLTVGDYMVVVTYLGDGEFNSNSTVKSFTIAGHVKKDTSISAVPKVDNYTATINIEVAENATGSVTIGILGQNFIVPVESGKAVFSYDFKPATYTANVTYLGDSDFNANSTTVTFTITEQKVELMNTTIDVDINSIENDVTITASVDSSASGLVEFNIGGQAVYVAVANGKAVYNTNLPAGDYNVEVVYLGDSKFNANRTSKVFVVVEHVKQNTTMNSDVVEDNNNVTIIVGVNVNATGFVKFNISGNELFAEVKGGKAVLNTILPVGNYSVAATYLGDDEFNVNSTEIKFSIVEKPLKDTPININVVIDDNNVTIEVVVDMNATGLVKFDVSGAENYTLYVEVVGGNAILEDVLKVGEYTVYATYMGDENYNMNSTSETFTIVGHVKNDTAISAVPAVDGSTVSISIDVDKNATGYVAIGILGQTFIVPVNDGKASFTYDFVPGTYSANIVYTGDDNFNNATTTATFTVIQKASELKNTTIGVGVKTVENDVTITASVDSSASGLVEFNIGGQAVYVAVANGKAVYNTNLPAGDYNVEVVYLGDSKFNANRTSVSFNVFDRIKKNTTIDSDVVVDGNNVSITVYVDANATGFVKFDMGGNELFAEVNGGKAVLNVALPSGNYTVTATYLGDDEFNENSTAVSFSVDGRESADANITIPSDIHAGDNATVKIDIPDATGNVTIYVDGMGYSAQLVNGSTDVNIPGLSSGNHSVVVEYSGDDRYAPFTKLATLNVPKVDIPEDDLKVNVTLPIGGKAPTVTIKLPEDTTGYALVRVNSYDYHIEVNNGTASIKLPALRYGKHNLEVIYPGDDKYNSVSKNITVNIPKPVLKTRSVVIRFTNKGPYKIRLLVDGKAVSGQYMTIKFNGKTYKRLTDSKGYARLKLPVIKPGTYKITAKYNDVSLSKTIKIANIIVVNTKKIKKSAKKVKIKVTLNKVNKKYLKSKTLTLKINGKIIKAKTNKKGVAMFTLKKSIVKNLKVGKTYLVRVSYGKDVVTKKIKILR